MAVRYYDDFLYVHGVETYPIRDASLCTFSANALACTVLETNLTSIEWLEPKLVAPASWPRGPLALNPVVVQERGRRADDGDAVHDQV